MPVSDVEGEPLTFPPRQRSFRMLRRESVNVTSRAIFMPVRIFLILMLSAFHHPHRQALRFGSSPLLDVSLLTGNALL